ncbi:hypothetical protein Sjap_025875 [Stephania japonica]|uniref:Nudix hydrolase domain-containing protein n=1 Tax=Stephania japonica TaxID=461633 RepID=A0AAP0EAC1_9MAGN
MNSTTSSLRLEHLSQQLSKIKHENKAISQVGIEKSAGPVENTQRIVRGRRRAPVLVCLFEDDDGQIRVILTMRSSKMSSHSGEVSLPGGVEEEGDIDAIGTATREAKEEIGLDPSLVNVVAMLVPPFLSKTKIRVTPVIGLLSDKQSFRPVLNPSEVETMFDVPLEMFLKDENWRVKQIQYPEYVYLLHSFEYKVENKTFMIWGLTAEILIHVASIVYQRLPNFVKQLHNFKVSQFVTSDILTSRM